MRNDLRVILLGSVLVLAALVSMLVATSGSFAFPLDDPYIYFRYAEQNAHGAFFRYNDADPPTTGATSLLYLLVLTPLAVVFGGTALAVSGFVIGAVLYVLTLRSVHALAGAAIGPRAAWPATLLLAASGPFLWGALSGMETPLVAFLAVRLVASVHVLLHGDTSTASARRRFGIAAALLALARPEAAVLVAALVALVLLVRRDRRALGVSGLVLPLLGALVPFALNLALTGRIGSTTLLSKGAIYLPGASVHTWLVESSRFLAQNLKGLLGSGASESGPWPNAYTTLVTYAAPFTLFFAGLGAFPRAVAELRARRPATFVTALVLVCGTLVVWSALVPINLHWSRYFTPFVPLVAFLVAAGVDRVASGLETDGAIYRGLVAFLVALSLPGLAFFLGIYGWNANETASQHVAMARWIRSSTPHGTWIGTNDVGAIAFLGGRPVLDLHGLTSAGFAEAKQVGSAATFERIERMSVSRRPGYLVVIPGWYDPEFFAMHRPVRSQSLRRPTIAGSPLVVYQTSWQLANAGDHPGPATLASIGGRRLRDRLDVADLESEAAHGYRIRLVPGQSAAPLGLRRAPGAPSIVPDGGRLVTISESFELALEPGADAFVVLRSMGALRADILVGGERIRVEGRQENDETFVEAIARVPAHVIRSSSTRVRIEAFEGEYQEGGYVSFHYWAYQ